MLAYLGQISDNNKKNSTGIGHKLVTCRGADECGGCKYRRSSHHLLSFRLFLNKLNKVLMGETGRVQK